MRFKLLLLATLMLTAGVAQSADPQPYVVHFTVTGNPALNAVVRASSQLESLRTNAPVGPFALVDRADQDVGRLQTVLGSFGYYHPTVTITINGQALNETGLPEQLTAMPNSESAKVEVHIEPGVLFHIRNVTVEGLVDEAAHKAMDLTFRRRRGRHRRCWRRVIGCSRRCRTRVMPMRASSSRWRIWTPTSP